MKKQLINKLIAGALMMASVLPLAGNVPVYAAETQKQNGWVLEKGNWYYYENGQMTKNTTITIKGQQYYFGADGVYVESEENAKAREEQVAKDKAAYEAYKAKYPETNECSEDYKKRDDRWTSKDGNWYFNWKQFDDDETIKDDWDFINGFWYHFNKDGVMDKNTTIKDECNNDCVLNSDGVLTNREDPEFKEDSAEGFVKYTKVTENGKDYYVNEKGEKKIGWVMDETDQKWHYTNADGVAQKSTTITENGISYVLDANGAWNK